MKHFCMLGVSKLNCDVLLQVDRPGSRVFALKFLAEADRTLLFWAQEPEETTDMNFIEVANLAVNSVNDGELAALYRTHAG